jgi:uncharacterized damage-inducible protein DinB
MPNQPTDGSSLKTLAFGDVERELAVTRRVLERLPEEKFAWQPHPKSMSLGRLAMHVANLGRWMLDTLERDGLDMQSPPQMRNEPTGLEDVLRTFDENAAGVKAALARADDESLRETWSLRDGEQVIYSNTRAAVLRVWCVSHMIHHRGQLCVLLRLLDVPVPAVYFNSTDEPEWVFE